MWVQTPASTDNSIINTNPWLKQTADDSGVQARRRKLFTSNFMSWTPAFPHPEPGVLEAVQSS